MSILINGIEYNAETSNADTHQPTGMTARSETTLSWDNGTKTLTVAKTGSTFSVYSNGMKYVKTANETKSISGGDLANDTMYWFYYGTDGVLTYSLSEWVFDTGLAPVAMVYWNGTAGTLQDERHVASRNINWHHWAHDTIGTRYENGLSGTFNANGTFSIATGTWFDEDIEISNAAPLTDCRMWYRNNAGAKVTFDTTAATAVWKLVSSVAQYDNAGVLTGIATGRYGVSWVYATNCIAYPIYIVLGQGSYQNAGAAAGAPLPSFPTQMPTSEMKLLYKVTYQQTGATTQAVTSSTDYRTSASLPGGSTTNPTASSVIYTPIGATTQTNVQGALDGLYGTQTVAAATDTLLTNVRYVYVTYTSSGAVTDIEWTASSTTAKQTTMFIDSGGRAGTNIITVKDTANNVLGEIAEDNGTITISAGDGTPRVIAYT